MMKSIILLILIIVIIGTSILTYSRLGIFYFAKGSDSTLFFAKPSPLVVAAITVCLTLFTAFLIWNVQLDFSKLIVLLLLLFVWFSMGRVVAVFPDSRIVAGWFFMSTKVIDFRDFGEDPESHASHTQVFVSSGWVLEIHSHKQTARLFVGPILQNSIVKLLIERGFDVRTMKGRSRL